MSDDREYPPGYYWVSVDGGEPEVAFWDQEQCRRCGWDYVDYEEIKFLHNQPLKAPEAA